VGIADFLRLTDLLTTLSNHFYTRFFASPRSRSGSIFAILQEIPVEFECFPEIVPDVSGAGFPDISIEIVAVGRVGAVVDN